MRVALGEDDDRRQLDVEDLGERFGREQVGLATPLEVRHEIRLGSGLAERGAERELVREREREVVALDGVEVDGLAGDLAVPVVQRGEVAEPDTVSRMRHAARSIIGSPMWPISTSSTATTRPS